MDNRRSFLKATLATAAMSRPVLGANERIRMGLIGCGTRGNMVSGFFGKHKDCVFVAACDVAKTKLEQTAAKLAGSDGKVDQYADHRRLLERKDIDAVLIATPDHWHSPMTVEACSAGKDVYVEKPISNTIEAAQKMVDAARQHNRIVQVGLQQREGQHFQEAAKLVQGGLLGNVTHAVLQFPGGYTVPPEPNQEPPADLDWNMFQGPAERRAYKPSRQRRWRAYYDYGGGLVTDWGVHLVDIAHWYLNADTKAPLLTSASAQYVNVPNPEHDQVPDAFIVSWQYDKFVMSFTNASVFNPDFPMHGNYFYGPRGCLWVHRSGYQVKPGPQRRFPGAPEPPPSIEARTVRFKESYEDDPDTIAHARNFLDCVRTRQRPVTDIAIGFNSTLPCLLGVLAIRQGRSLAWDGKIAKPA
jgi:myo-inositol 2-dehydrogenase / D-chiro-inositol 1-dehydrogenase